jgi:hypothetical protein
MIKSSIIASVIILNFSGCLYNNENVMTNNQNQQLEFLKEKQKIKRSINIKTGDSLKTVLERLSSINNNIYIIEEDANFSSKISVNGIVDLEELKQFLEASNYKLEEEQKEGSKYVKIRLVQLSSSIEARLKETKITINGNIQIDEVIKMIATNSKTEIIYEDKLSNDIAKTNQNFNFDGDGLNALREIVNSSDLNIEFKENKVYISYFKTETMNIDIFTRDRQTTTDISIAMSNNSSNNSTSTTSTSSSSETNDKDLSITYKTDLVKDLVKSLDSVKSEHGSYTFMPSSGQVLIRDKATNVKVAQKLISDFNAQFKDTIELTLTFYKVITDKTNKHGIDFKALGSKLDFTTTNFSASNFTTGTSFFSLAANSTGESNAVLNFLNEYGQAEVMNPISFETQSNMLKTIKIANNYGYISSIKSSTDSNGTTTAEVTPSSIADGGFISAIAKPIGNDFIAVDLYSTTTSLSKFNSVTAFGSTVQTPDTAEQSIDGYHQIKAGVPFILISHKYEETKTSEAGLPIEQLRSIGFNSDQNKDVYIVIALEAKIRG